MLYLEVVKSISLAGLKPPSEAFSQVQAPTVSTLEQIPPVWITRRRHTLWTGATLARSAGRFGVLSGSSIAGTLAGRAGAARASRTLDLVLAGGLVAGAVHGGLLAA